MVDDFLTVKYYSCDGLKERLTIYIELLKYKDLCASDKQTFFVFLIVV